MKATSAAASSVEVVAVKVPGIPRLVRDLAAGETVTLPATPGSNDARVKRFSLSCRDEVILWLLTRYRCIAVIDLAEFFGAPTTTHTLQMRGNLLERAGLIRRYTLPGRVIVWVITRAGQFLAGVDDAPELPRRSGPMRSEVAAAYLGMRYEKNGHRVATRRELLAGHYFDAPTASHFVDASLDLELPIQLSEGPGLAHCPDFMLRGRVGDGPLLPPQAINFVLEVNKNQSTPMWQQVVDGYSGRRPFVVVHFITTDRQIARQIASYLAGQGVTGWVRVALLPRTKHWNY